MACGKVTFLQYNSEFEILGFLETGLPLQDFRQKSVRKDT